MRFVVIVGNVVLNSFIKFKTVICRVQKDIIVLDGFPEPLNPDIVRCPALSIHGDLYPFGFEILGPKCAGVLAALVRVDDHGLSVIGNGLLQDELAPFGC